MTPPQQNIPPATPAPRPPAAPPPGFLSSVQAPQGVWDETRRPGGAATRGWSKLSDHLARMPADYLARRWARTQRLMAEATLHFQPGEEAPDSAVSWEIDPLPLLIEPKDWEVLRRGLVQRATLINHVLADLYGYQRLLREGILPPELVFSHPGFLRPCHGLSVPNGQYLHHYAVDLVRRPDGNWVVIADHAQAPAGAGYSLENRLMLLRALPELYHELQVERILGFFNILKNSLRALSPRSENPRMVLLTPGTGDPSYYEHVFLARQLGCHVVEGSDLSVRDNAVFLKTLGGLLPVDVVLRRVEDAMCDPLELKYDSMLGVPGLVQALHDGRIAVANALGTGLLDSPILMPYLPGLCRNLLGEELLLISAETKWCGNLQSLRDATDNVERYLIKPVHEEVGIRTTYGGALSVGEREALLARIKEYPCNYVAQEHVSPSCSPCWQNGKLESRPISLRCYLVATEDGYEVLPGGLGRVTHSSPDQIGKPRQRISKDAWVLSDGPVVEPSLLQQAAGQTVLARTGLDMPSRVADNLFWLGRYAERTEGSVRCFRRLIARLTDEGALGTTRGAVTLPEIQPILRTLAANGLLPIPEKQDHRWTAAEIEQLLSTTTQAIVSPDSSGNLRQLTRHLRRLAWVMRDRMSNDMWRILGSLETGLAAFDADETPPSPADLHAALDGVMMPLAALGGLVAENMTRGPGWRFLDMGRRIERAFQATSLAFEGLSHVSSDEPAMLQALLDVGDCSLTYRSRYLSNLQAEPVLDLILLDETNPRSTIYQLDALVRHIEALQASWTSAVRSEEERLALAMSMRFRLAQPGQINEVAPDGTRPQLKALLEPLIRELPAMSDALTRHYFSHAEPPQTWTS